MTIAVIIPVLNEARLIGRTLSHTVALGFDDIIVVDGGSSDQTCSLVESFAIQLGPLPLPAMPQPPVLFAFCRRRRAALVNSMPVLPPVNVSVLLFLHADTQLPPDAKQAISEALLDDTFVGGRFNVRFDSDRSVARIIGGLMNLRSRWSGIATGDQAIFVRREVFERIGGSRIFRSWKISTSRAASNEPDASSHSPT